MAELAVRDWSNKQLRTLALDDAVFDYPLKEHLIYEAVCAYRAAGRSGTHKTKNRREVSGGTRKLWKQKHTGRARMGDNRSPLWRHGGTVHGPVPRDYGWSFPRKMRRNAIKSALAQKLRDGKLLCIESLERDTPKTAELASAISGTLGLEGKVLLVPEEESRNLQLAARNLPRVSVVRSMGVSIVDLLDNDVVVASEAALRQWSEVLA